MDNDEAGLSLQARVWIIFALALASWALLIGSCSAIFGTF